jgi:hypothetical protein
VFAIAPRSPLASGVLPTMRAAASRITLNVPIRFTSIARRNESSGNGAPSLPTVRVALPIPAQFTTPRSGPNAAIAASSASSTCASSVTSPGRKRAACPSSFSSSAPFERGRS